jgi:rubredoxin
MDPMRESVRMKYRQCGYVYDPATGDARSGIAPGVAFADLSGDWVCPKCRAEKSLFKEV